MAESAPRLSRDLSFKHRFRLNFGFDDAFYDQCLAYREAWQDKLFYVDEDILKQQSQWITKSLQSSADLDIPDSSLQPINRDQLLANVSTKTLELDFVRNNKSSSVKIPFGEGLDLSKVDRKGYVVNTGGQITSMKWLPQPQAVSGPLYLAVSVISSLEDIRSLVNHPELSIFNTKVDPDNNSINSSVQIWRYENASLALDKVYLTSKFGAVNQLSFLPIVDQSVIGIVGVLCGDGRLRYIKIKPDDSYAVVESASLAYELADYRSQSPNSIISITSYDYLGPNKILAGFADGSLAEFIIPTAQDTLYNYPSYVHSVADTPITTVSVAEPTPGQYFVSVNTTGSTSFVFEYNNFVHGRVECTPNNSFLKPIAHPFLRVYVVSDSSDSISYSFVRHPQEKPGLLMKTDGVITALHLPEFIGHPLALCGTSFGEVHVINICRKLLNGTKSTSKTLVPMRLWKLWKEGNVLKLYGDFDVVPTEKVSRLAVTPTEIVFSSVAWNESIGSGATYAAGTLSGFIVVETLTVD